MTAKNNGNTAKRGDLVIAVEGSSDGHTGIVIDVTPQGVRIKRDADGACVHIATGNYAVIASRNNETN